MKIQKSITILISICFLEKVKKNKGNLLVKRKKQPLANYK